MRQMFLALATFDDDVSGGAVGVRVWREAFEFITSPIRLKYGLDLM